MLLVLLLDVLLTATSAGVSNIQFHSQSVSVPVSHPMTYSVTELLRINRPSGACAALLPLR